MSSSRRIFLFAGFITVALVGSPVITEAHGPRHSTVVVHGGVYMDPFGSYDPWYYGAQWGPYPYPPPPYPAGVYYGAFADLRLDVTPREAEVYLDGFYAGIVDDFDGVFQRLHAEPGDHELTLFLDGFRRVTQHIYMAPGSTFKVKYGMERAPAGEPVAPRPVPQLPPQAGPGGQPGGPETAPAPPGSREPRRPPTAQRPPEPRAQAPSAPAEGATGALEIVVMPGDADVVVDGQPWRVPEGQDRIVIDTTEGRHTVQVRKAGYIGYLTEVQVRRGETTMLNVSLRTPQ